jgi:hypothetical protein
MFQREMIRAFLRRVEIGLDQVYVVFRVDAFAGKAEHGKKLATSSCPVGLWRFCKDILVLALAHYEGALVVAFAFNKLKAGYA